MAFDINNPYLRNQILTATPERLRLFLLDGCLHFLELGREGLVEKNFEKMFDNFSQAREIVLELLSGLRPEIAPDLCNKLAGVYTFVFQRLTEAGFEKSIEKADEVIKIMQYERETWMLLIEKINGEKAGKPSASPTPSIPTPITSGDDQPRRSISLSA